MASEHDAMIYRDKTSWIMSALSVIATQREMQLSGTEHSQLNRIMKTNNTNRDLLMYHHSTPEEIGMMTFFFLKKTVNMNENTMRSMLMRHGIDPDNLSQYFT